MMWLKNFERVQEIQQQIQWQPVTELEPRAFIPEVYGFCSTLDRFDTLVSCCSHFDVVNTAVSMVTLVDRLTRTAVGLLVVSTSDAQSAAM